jgi:hypothetical protein
VFEKPALEELPQDLLDHGAQGRPPDDGSTLHARAAGGGPHATRSMKP